MRRAACLLLLASTVAWAADAPPTIADEPPTGQATGTLTTSDAGAISLERRGETLRFRVDATTRVLIAAEPGALGDLKPQDRVQVVFVRQGDPPYLAQSIHDAATVAILETEREGVKATLVAVEQRTVEDEPATVVIVDTEHGKRRELIVQADGPRASVILRDGAPAEPASFAAGSAVIVSIRRTGGAAMYLGALGDPESFVAFCGQRTLRGTVAGVDAEGRLQVTVEGEAAPVTVRLTRGTSFWKGEAKVPANPFATGDAVVVKFLRREQGVVIARAIWDPASWRAYAREQLAPAALAEGGQT